MTKTEDADRLDAATRAVMAADGWRVAASVRVLDLVESNPRAAHYMALTKVALRAASAYDAGKEPTPGSAI